MTLACLASQSCTELGPAQPQLVPHPFVTTVKLPVMTNVLITQWRGHINNDTRDSIRFCSRFGRLLDLISESYRVEVKSRFRSFIRWALREHLTSPYHDFA